MQAEHPEGSADSTSRGQRRRTIRRRVALGGVAVLMLGGASLVGVGLWWGAFVPDTDEAAPTATARAATDVPVPEEAAPQADEPSENGAPTPMAVADPAWVARVADEAGIPERALAAYASAALTLSAEQPTCGIGWNTLAGIGHVESGHGSIGGATLHDDGRVTPRVLGVPLDGTEFEAITDTDGGKLDGDAQWDRAVGPMQFIPSTWEIYGRDGNGDGEADPDHIDDAALSAATLLCAEGGDLTVPENWITALNAYNPSVSYNNDVVDAADYYATLG